MLALSCVTNVPVTQTLKLGHIYIIIIIMCFTSGAGTAYPSGAHEFIPVFSGVLVTRSSTLCECFVDRCLSLWPFFF